MSSWYYIIKDRYKKYFSKLEPSSYYKTGLDFVDRTYTNISLE
jgi:hypothetical protein